MYLWCLVLLQFILSAVIVLSANWWPLPVISLLIALPGILLAIWAWLRIGLTKIRVHPDVTESTELVTDGPYSIVRHPMYSGLLWFAGALLFEPFQLWRIACWFALVVVLVVKSRHEESGLVSRFASYREYQEQVGSLVPRFW